MTLRLFHDYFIGEIATIGYDYSRTCYDYSSRNATTIADLYWLSGDSPKRDAAVAANGSAPPATGQPRRVEGARSQAAGLTLYRWRRRPRRACMVCGMLHCLAWIHNRGAPLHSYIHYYNRAAALTCTAFGVVLVSGMCWRHRAAVIRSSVRQVVL